MDTNMTMTDNSLTDDSLIDNLTMEVREQFYQSASNLTGVPREWLIACGFYLTCVGATALFGNVVVLLVLLRDPRLRNKPHNMLLINLAVSDFLTLLGGHWVTATSAYMDRWLFGDTGCILVAFWTYFTSLTSMNTLVAICVYRYIMICLPGKSFILNKTVTIYTIMFTWMYSTFWCGLPLLGWGGYGPEPFMISCSLTWDDHSYSNTTYLGGCIIFCYALHVVIMIRCYRGISKAVGHIAERDRQRGRVISVEEVIHTATVTDDQQVTRMCFLVVLVFVGVWTPYAVICAVHIFYTDMPITLTAIPTMCAKAGCMLNPLTYFVTNKSFRNKAAELLCHSRQINAVAANPPNLRRENFDKVTKEGIYLGTETVTVQHEVTMF